MKNQCTCLVKGGARCLPDERSTVLAVSRASERPRTAALDTTALDAWSTGRQRSSGVLSEPEKAVNADYLKTVMRKKILNIDPNALTATFKPFASVTRGWLNELTPIPSFGLIPAPEIATLRQQRTLLSRSASSPSAANRPNRAALSPWFFAMVGVTRFVVYLRSRRCPAQIDGRLRETMRRVFGMRRRQEAIPIATIVDFPEH